MRIYSLNVKESYGNWHSKNNSLNEPLAFLQIVLHSFKNNTPFISVKNYLPVRIYIP